MEGEPEVKIDMDNRLQITLNNRDPVVLTDLVQSLLAVSSQFERFIKTRSNSSPEACTELLIHEVRKGSIVVELIAYSLPAVPLIWGDGAIHEWVNYARSIIDWLSGKGEKPHQKITKNDLGDYSSIVTPVAKDNSSQITFTAINGGEITNHFHVCSNDATNIQRQVTKEIESMDESSDSIKRKQYMTWYQTRFGNSLTSGNQAIIENLSKKPKRVIFQDEETKRSMSKGDARFSRDWQELAYLVDVDVQFVNGQPRPIRSLNITLKKHLIQQMRDW